MLEELKPYLDMANGLTEVTRQRATEVAKALIAQGMALSAKGEASDKDVRDVADEVLTSVKANREFLLDLVRTEVQKATGAMGFVHTDELDSLRRHIERLERQVTTVKAQLAELAKAAEAAEADEPKPKAKKKAEPKKKSAKASA
jgi:polyhydroxyalkanoate synthesis regulator phasin